MSTFIQFSLSSVPYCIHIRIRIPSFFFDFCRINSVRSTDLSWQSDTVKATILVMVALYYIIIAE